MRVGIIGLGLIGGSFAKSYHKSGATVLAHDIDDKILDYGLLSGIVDEKLTKDNINKCDIIILAVYADDIITYVKELAPYVRSDAIVIDCNGVKSQICSECFPIAREYGFTFVGGHPMAGSHLSFFKHSDGDMFKGAYMVLVPETRDDIRLLARLKELLEPAGFGHFNVTTAKEHDAKIAYTSQMAHLIASSYIQNPDAEKHRGYSADSFAEMTRVAWINSNLWGSLLLENRDNVLKQLDIMIENLSEYRKAIEKRDIDAIRSMLDNGTEIKKKAEI